jgi:hypothetical protein
VQVLLNWSWNWLLNTRDARLITGDAHVEVQVPRADEHVTASSAVSASDARRRR